MINLSHSKLNTIMTCPMSYYLNYEQGISLKQTKSAFALGSAVHWGIEHNTEDLTEYWDKDFRTKDNYTKEQLLAEAMVHGYLKQKDNLFNEILTDPETGEKLEILDEIHELALEEVLPSKRYDGGYNFVGIIDLLLLTNKGFIIIDYKTSSTVPEWDKYLDQIYRYEYLLSKKFPEEPIVGVGIINLRKAAIRQKNNENEVDFLNRLKFEYELNEANYISSHMFRSRDIDMNLLNKYIENLRLEADTAQTIVDNKMYFINYSNAINMYGKSDYYDIFYHTPEAYKLYKIRDLIWDNSLEEFRNDRDCNELDMQTIDFTKKILNHYKDFLELTNEFLEKENIKVFNREELLAYITASGYDVDNDLYNLYVTTYFKQKENEELMKGEIIKEDEKC